MNTEHDASLDAEPAEERITMRMQVHAVDGRRKARRAGEGRASCPKIFTGRTAEKLAMGRRLA
jgi:hypothetical protein